jgi:hypothetical protein
MVVGRTFHYVLLLSAFLAFPQSCGTNPASLPPTPTPLTEAADAEPTDAVAPEIASARLGQKGWEVPELLVEPLARDILPESILDAPDRDLAPAATKYDTVLVARMSGTPLNSVWEYRTDPQGKVVGFEFSNRGGNRILPQRYNIDQNHFFTRDFQFRFEDRARQDMHLFLTDWAPSRDRQFRLSELMNSVIYFFPRTYVPAITETAGRSIVTLPTGEEVEFDAKTHEVLGGVFSEGPVDLNPDKTARKFAGVSYTGKGLVVRANARGTDPRLGTMATIITPSQAAHAEKGIGSYQCRVPSTELWEQEGAVRFKFSTDEEFDRYLVSRCGFGLPRNDADLMSASLAQ